MLGKIKGYIKPKDLKVGISKKSEFILSNDLGVELERDLYLQVEAKSEFDFNSDKTKREKNGNIVYNQGVKANLYAVVGLNLENSIKIINQNDSIEGIFEVVSTLYGDGFLFEFYRSSILDTNNWILKYYFNLSIGIGNLIEPIILGGIAEIIKEILRFDILTTIQGEIDIKEKAKESKKELYGYAMNILYNEFKNPKMDSLVTINFKKRKELNTKELKKRALLKAWKIKHYQIKQNLSANAKNKISNFIPAFFNALNESIKKLIDKKIKNKFIKKSTFFVISNIEKIINRLSTVFLLAIFSKPIEKVINEITLKDLKKA